MEVEKYSWSQLGMLLGIFVGGGLATILFATTGRAEMWLIVGATTAIGVILGAGLDRTEPSRRERRASRHAPDRT